MRNVIASLLLWSAAAGYWNAPSAKAADDLSPATTEPTVTRDEAAAIQAATARFESDAEGAIRSLRERAQPNASAAVEFALATMLARRERFAEAAASLETAVKKRPRFARAWLLLGRVRLLNGKPAEAISPLNEALALGAGTAEIYTLLGFAHLETGQAVAAESAYRQVLALHGENREAMTGLARSLLLQDRSDAAAPLLQALCRQSPEKGDLWVLRANAALARADNRRAIMFLECSRRLSGDRTTEAATLGDLYFNEGLYEKSTACYQEAGRSAAIGPEALLRFAEALIDANQPKFAQSVLKEMPRDSAASGRAAYLQARIAVAEGKKEEALTQLQKFLADSPLDGDGLMLLARIQKESGETEKALLTLERASHLDKVKPQALLERAQIHVSRREYGKAAELLDEAQRIAFQPDVERYLAHVRRALDESEK